MTRVREVEVTAQAVMVAVADVEINAVDRVHADMIHLRVNPIQDKP